MATETLRGSKEVNSFEEYTLYSLDESCAGVLRMMENSKQVAGLWPDVTAMVGMAGLCQEMAALASFQNSLCETLGDMQGQDGENWKCAREELQQVMKMLEDSLTLNDPDVVRRLFGISLPISLNRFIETIPALKRHVCETYLTDGSAGDGTPEEMQGE